MSEDQQDDEGSDYEGSLDPEKKQERMGLTPDWLIVRPGRASSRASRRPRRQLIPSRA